MPGPSPALVIVGCFMPSCLDGKIELGAAEADVSASEFIAIPAPDAGGTRLWLIWRTSFGSKLAYDEL